jgi:DNA-binding response OmpR family regulator
MNEHILLIEDDDLTAVTMRAHLEAEGYRLHREADGLDAIARIGGVGNCNSNNNTNANNKWDMVLLDLGLPRADGWDVCRYLQLHQPNVPVVMITGRDSEAHRVIGLELGADDYLIKPFSLLELNARIRAIFRRVGRKPQDEGNLQNLSFGKFHMNAVRREFKCDDQFVALTRREFDLLWFFASHPRRVFSRAELLRQVWGNAFDGYEHAVNSQINRLRMKIEADPLNSIHILTVWGVGYQFEPNK